MNEPRGASVPLVFLDTETTELNPRTRRAWDVAMIRRETDGEETTYRYFVTDVDLADANPFSLRVGHFYHRHPIYQVGRQPEKGYVSVCEQVAAEEVERVTRGAHLVGAVPSFDAQTLEDMLWRHGLIPAWHHHLIDVETLAAGWTGQPPLYDSRELSATLGIDRSKYAEHTGYGDALWARDLFDAVMYEQHREFYRLDGVGHAPFPARLSPAPVPQPADPDLEAPRRNRPVPYAVTEAGNAALAAPHSSGPAGDGTRP